jgi:hypothetical protein
MQLPQPPARSGSRNSLPDKITLKRNHIGVQFTEEFGEILLHKCMIFYLGTVHVEPPVTDKILLIEQGPVGTQEGELEWTTYTIGYTNVELLALALGICIVANLSAFTEEGCLQRSSQNRVVLPRDSRDRGPSIRSFLGQDRRCQRTE